MYMYIVLAVPRQDSIRLACANAVQASCCPVTATNVLEVTKQKTCISCTCVECRGFEYQPRQLIFLRKSDYLGCAVLPCLVNCLFDLACFFLPSFPSKHVHCM